MTVEKNVASRRPARSPQWHAEFLKMLPLICRVARYAFQPYLAGDDYDDAVQEVVANATVAYVRLVEQGRADDARGSSLGNYAVSQYWSGRRVGAKLNIRDAMSVHCRRNKGVQIEPLHHWDYLEQDWQEVLVEDKTITPAELAASRIDFSAWLDSLDHRDRQIAEMLAHGESTSWVAKAFGNSKARVSQLRRELQSAWREFHEPLEELAAAV